MAGASHDTCHGQAGCVGFRVWGLGFRFQGLGFRVQGLGFRIRFWGLRCRFYRSFYRVCVRSFGLVLTCLVIEALDACGLIQFLLILSFRVWGLEV